MTEKRLLPQRDAEDHECGAWALYDHHGYTESSNELHLVRVCKLRRVLDSGKQGGGDAEESCPCRYLVGSIGRIGRIGSRR